MSDLDDFLAGEAFAIVSHSGVGAVCGGGRGTGRGYCSDRVRV